VTQEQIDLKWKNQYLIMCSEDYQSNIHHGRYLYKRLLDTHFVIVIQNRRFISI